MCGRTTALTRYRGRLYHWVRRVFEVYRSAQPLHRRHSRVRISDPASPMTLFTGPKQGLLRGSHYQSGRQLTQLGCFRIQIQLSVATILNGIQANSSQSRHCQRNPALHRYRVGFNARRNDLRYGCVLATRSLCGRFVDLTPAGDSTDFAASTVRSGSRVTDSATSLFG